MTSIDDRTLEAWLAEPPDELADNGFTAAVMSRVQADIARGRGALDAEVALARLRVDQARARRSERWRWLGAGAGVVIAALPMLATDGGVTELAPAQLLALVMALGAAAWLLSESAARGA